MKKIITQRFNFCILCLLPLLQESLTFYSSYSYRVQHSPTAWSYVNFNPPSVRAPLIRRRQTTAIRHLTSQPSCRTHSSGYYVGELTTRMGTKCYDLCDVPAGTPKSYHCCPRRYLMDLEQKMCVELEGTHSNASPVRMREKIDGQSLPKSKASSLELLYEQSARQATSTLGTSSNIISRTPPDSGCHSGLLLAHPTNPRLYYLCSPDLTRYELRRCAPRTRWSAMFRMCYDWRRFDADLNPIVDRPPQSGGAKGVKKGNTNESTKPTVMRRRRPLPSDRSRCLNRWPSYSRGDCEYSKSTEGMKHGDINGVKKTKTMKKQRPTKTHIRLGNDESRDKPIKGGDYGQRISKKKTKTNDERKRRFWERRRTSTTTETPGIEKEEEEELVILTTSTTPKPTTTIESVGVGDEDQEELIILTTSTTSTTLRPTIYTTTTSRPMTTLARKITTTTETPIIEEIIEITRLPAITTTEAPIIEEIKEITIFPTTTSTEVPIIEEIKEITRLPTITTPPTTWTKSPVDEIDTPQPILDTTTAKPILINTNLTSTTERPITTSLPPLDLTESAACYEPGARYRDIDDCQCFYRCEANRRLSRQCCPEGQFFDQIETKPGEGSNEDDSSEDSDPNSYCDQAERVQCKNIIQ